MGGFAEYGLVTDTQALLEDDPTATPNSYCQYQQRIPAGLRISPADATMLVTLKEIASTVRDVGVEFGAKVAVLGTGAVGMAMCYFAKLRGAYPVIAVGRRDQPLADCVRTGADFGVNCQKEDMVAKVMELTGGTGVDFVLDAAGDTTLVMESGKLLARNGAIATYATSSGGGTLALDKIQGPARWRFLQSGPDETSAHQYLLDLARVGAVPFKNFYSHSIPLGDFEAGFKLLVEKKAFKIAFVMDAP